MRNKLMFTTALLLTGIGTAIAQTNAGTQGSTRPSTQQTQEHSGQAPSAQRNTDGEERRGAQSNRRETSGQAPSAGREENRSQSREKSATESGARNSGTPSNTETRSQDHSPSEQGAVRDNQPRNQNLGQQEPNRRSGQQETNQRAGQQEQRSGQQEPRSGQQDTGGRTGQQEGSERGGDRANNQRGDRGTTSGQTGRNDREPPNGSVTLTSEQRTRIRDTVLSGRNVPRVDNVTFAINVGSRVPADIRIVEVPSALIDIHPEWRSDSYFVVRDEIVIVDGSRNIVATVPVDSSNARLENRGGSASVKLTSVEIREIQTELQRQGFEIGAIDGVLGARTREAIVAFQKRSGFQATGELDRDTYTALNERKGDKGVSEQRNDRGGQQGNAAAGREESPSRQPSQTQTNNPRENTNASPQNASPKDAQTDRESSTTGQGNRGERNVPAPQSQRRNENQR
jgi:hypothetical protein